MGVFGRWHARLARALACVALCLAAAGCVTVDSSISSALGPSAPARDRNASISFDSIDGLARDGESTLMHDLNEEAAAFYYHDESPRALAVVRRVIQAELEYRDENKDE